MIKQTLYFGSQTYLSVKNEQLVIRTAEKEVTRPIEDLGLVFLDNPQITITQYTLNKLLANNVSVITCNDKHLPIGMFLNLEGNTLQSLKFKFQINATDTLKKNLWQQTIIAKLQNQASVLKILGKDAKRLDFLVKKVKPGDTENCEAQGANWYWSLVFEDFTPNFFRYSSDTPNNILNYGYAILRSATARALTGSGLLPTLGIFHRNQYNAYCLADDIMEPYRPFVDLAVVELLQKYSLEELEDVNMEIKKAMLSVMQFDCFFKKEKSPLLVALTRTTASLSACFEGKKRKILYPEIKYEHKRIKPV